MLHHCVLPIRSATGYRWFSSVDDNLPPCTMFIHGGEALLQLPPSPRKKGGGGSAVLRSDSSDYNDVMVRLSGKMVA